MIKTLNIGDINLAGPCDHETCKNSPAGNTVQVSQSDDTINISLNDIEAFVLALKAVGGRL